MIVYLATNKINGKRYVGITRQSLRVRQNEHRSRAANGKRAAFHHAIRKYGWDAFAWVVLKQCASLEELEQEERKVIALLNTRARIGHGYNRTDGGGGTAGTITSDETRQRLRLAAKRTNYERFGLTKQLNLFHQNVGRSWTDERRREHAEILRGIDPALRFRKIPLEADADIREALKNGETQRSLAKRYGVSPAAMCLHVKKLAA